MYDTDQDMLSMMMDGEWDELDPSRCAALVCDDPVARSRWARYHMIRDVLNNEPVRIDTDLALRVRASIDAEPAYTNVARLQGATESVTDETSPVGSPAAGPEHGAAGVAPAGLSRTPAERTAVVPAARSRTAPVHTDEPCKDEARAGRARVAKARTAGYHPVPPETSTQPVRRTVAGLAVAASMALVTVVGLDRLTQGGDAAIDGSGAGQVAAHGTTGGADLQDAGAGQPASAKSVAQAVPRSGAGTNLPGTVLPQVEYVSNRGSHWVTGSQKRQATAESRLNMFLSQHIENSPTAEHQGMLPYSRLVGYDELPAK